MAKKKYILIGLSTLLLVLLLGLSTSCLAFSENDMKNLLYQRVNVKFNETDSKAIVDKINISNMWNGHFNKDLSQYFDNPDYTYICLGQSNTRGLYFFICEKNQAKKYMYTMHNDLRLFIPGELSFPGVIWTNLSSYNDVSSFQWFGDVSNQTFQAQEIATGWFKSEYLNTWDFTYRENITHPAPFSDPSSWTTDNGPYITSKFGFEEVDTNTHVKLASDGVSMPLYYSLGSSVYFADFIDDDGTGQTIFGKNLTGDELYMYYYTVSSWNGSVNLFRRNFNSISDFKTNRYINVNRTISGYTENKLSLNSNYVLTNVVYNYIINYEEDGINKFINYYFYIGDNNTTTIDGIIDVPSSIPDMETYHNRISNTENFINNNNNTDKIVDSIESGDNALMDDSDVSSIISSNLDSGELLGRLSFSEYHYSGDFIVYTIFSNICDVLLDDEDVYFDYSMHGERPTRIYASDFTTPDNRLTQFIRVFIIFIFLYVGFYNIKHIIDLINEGKAPLILEEEDADIVIAKM